MSVSATQVLSAHLSTYSLCLTHHDSLWLSSFVTHCIDITLNWVTKYQTSCVGPPMCSCQDVKQNPNTYLTLFLRQGGKLLIVYYVLFDPTQRHERTQSPRNRRGEGRNSKLCHISFPCMYIECGIVLNVGFPRIHCCTYSQCGGQKCGVRGGVCRALDLSKLGGE